MESPLSILRVPPPTETLANFMFKNYYLSSYTFLTEIEFLTLELTKGGLEYQWPV